jgi:hypothetical protein
MAAAPTTGGYVTNPDYGLERCCGSGERSELYLFFSIFDILEVGRKANIISDCDGGAVFSLSSSPVTLIPVRSTLKRGRE